MGGLLKTVYHYCLPRQLEYYPNCKSVFQSGVGLEIGGPSHIFGRRGSIPIYPVARKIDNCNFSRSTVWEGTIHEGNSFVFSKGTPPGHQYVGEASSLAYIDDSTYDFVLSSHCIEHLANPMQGLAEWIRVLKHDGLLVLVIPHKDGTFDHRRPVTSLEHLIHDFEHQTDEGDLSHLEEILRLHDLTKDPAAGDFRAFEERSKRNCENRCLHHHVFDTRLAVEVVDYMGLEILTVEHFYPFHIAIITRKVARDPAVSNEKYKGVMWGRAGQGSSCESE